MKHHDWAARLLSDRDPVGSWPTPGGTGSGWQLATVAEVIPEAPDTVTLRMRRSDGKAFLPGQHVLIEVPTGARFPAVASYSVASSPWPDPQTVDFTIKELHGGRVSPMLVRRIPVTTVLRIDGPLGYFTWSEQDGGPLALVGAGSGIVPLMAIIRYAVAKDLRVPISLLYSSKDRIHAIYYRELSELVRCHAWLRVVHTFTGGRSDPAAEFHRRIDSSMLSDVFTGMAQACLAYVCGPFEMVKDAEVGLTAAGVVQGRLMSETWG